MKCLFVINPVSGTQHFQNSINVLIGELILKTPINTVDVFYTSGKHDARNRCAILVKNQYDLIICLGGDGTVNEVMDGVIRSGSDIPIAFLPAGTVNDFATYLSLPTSISELVDLVNEFHISRIDVGQVGEDVFANVISGGMFSDIAFQVSSQDKNTFGPLAYYVAGLTQLPQQLAMNLHLNITTDMVTFEEEASLFMITNTSHVGGFEGITPLATVEDGLLDLIIIKRSNVAELLAVITDYALNRHTQNPNITYLQTKYIKIECEEDIHYDVDGEEGSEFPIEVRCLPKAVSILTFKDKTEL
ncbi:MAG: diacylglycerol kinase family lipid kinase [Erysipelotrichaceae bacterium]|nr:diacylglycerol kinase family lipid kinase [Erysipelotrichaceae bacterium]